MEQPLRKSWWTLQACQLTARDQANSQRFSVRALVWCVTFVAATLILKAGVLESRAAQIAVAAVPTALGLTVGQAYLLLLREADELLRRIHMEALAMGFGAGALFMMSYRLFERIGAPKLDLNDPLLVMVLFWIVGQFLGQRRYA